MDENNTFQMYSKCVSHGKSHGSSTPKGVCQLNIVVKFKFCSQCCIKRIVLPGHFHIMAQKESINSLLIHISYMLHTSYDVVTNPESTGRRTLSKSSLAIA